MIRRTFGEVKNDLARVAGAAGQSMSSDQIKYYVNVATEELMNEYDFASVIDRIRFNITNCVVTLPGAYDRIMMFTIDQVPQVMQSPWYEFVGFGLDLMREWIPNPEQLDYLRWMQGVLDREEVCIFKDIPPVALGTQYTLQIASTIDERIDGEQPTNVIIQGLDGNGQPIRTQNADGTFIDGVSFPWQQGGVYQIASSPQVYSSVTGVLKPETREPLNLYMTPVGLSEFTQIGRWLALETTPSYRRYFIPGLRANTLYTGVARCRLRYVPVSTDDDYLILSNLPALKAMIMAVYYLESNQPEDYAKYKSVAIDILKKESKAYIGLQRQKPFITFDEAMGVSNEGVYIL
jgi:hypothetical protein